MPLGFLPNLDVFIVGASVAAMGIIGATIFFSDTRSVTTRIFLQFSLISALWGTVNYLSYQNFSEDIVLQLVRLVIFFATWQAFLFFYLSLIFPLREHKLSRISIWILHIFTLIVSVLTLTPYVFKAVIVSGTTAPTIVPGPLIPVFAITGFGFVLLGFINLIRRRRRAEQKERVQINFFLLGALAMFALILLFNLGFPILLNDPSYIPLGALFTLPFLGSIAYAIVRHKLLDAKVAATEGLTFILLTIILLELLVIEDKAFFYFQVAVFLCVLFFSILLIRSVIWEVSARQQIEKLKEQLEEANHELKLMDEAKSDFVSIASHQLRTPLTVIKGYMSMLNEGTFGVVPDKMKQPIDKAFQSSERLGDLVENLLSVSRIERGTMKYNFAAVSFSDLAKSVTEELASTAHKKSLELSYVSEGNLPQVTIDEEKIRQIMVNLIDNAIKYTAKGSVSVKVSKQSPDTLPRLKKPSIVFTVTDTGDGVPKDVQSELFKKFVRGQNEIHIKGTGLGLYVGRMMVEAHKGQIWVQSDGEGKGSTFGFAIPLATGVV